MYMGIAFIGLVLFWFILPETRGKSLEEMEELFRTPLFRPRLRRRRRRANDYDDLK